MTASLAKRYSARLASSIVGVPISMGTQMLVPRLLGPESFGLYTFVASFFQNAMAFLEVGALTRFYTRVSQQPGDTRLRTFFWGLFAAIGLVSLLSVGGVFVCHREQQLWPGVGAKTVWLGLLFGLVTWHNGIMQRLVDAFGLTVQGEVVRMIQRVLGFGMTALLLAVGARRVDVYLVTQVSLGVALSLGSHYVLARDSISPVPIQRLSRDEIAAFSSDAWRFSAPLLAASFVGPLSVIIDRWILQESSGAIEQGYFGVANQLNAAIFMFTAAMASLLTREFSQLHAGADVAEMRRLFLLTVPALFLVSAFFGVFCAVDAARVSQLFAGKAYAGAVPTIAIMSIYPLYQTYGQLTGSVFFATGHTTAYRNTVVIPSVVGVPLLFFLAGPRHMGGLELGAVGLATKMVLMGVLLANARLMYCAQVLGIPRRVVLFPQVAVISSFAFAAFVAIRLTSLVSIPPLVALSFDGIIYSVLVLAIAFWAPRVVGLTPEHVAIIKRLKVSASSPATS